MTMVEELSIKVKELREKPVPAPQKDSREAEMIVVSERKTPPTESHLPKP